MSRLSCALCAVVLLVGGLARAEKDDDDDKGSGNAQAVEARKQFATGNEKYAKGDYEGAIAAFRAAITADARLPGPYRNLGLVYRAQGNCEAALPMYEKYLELKPESRFTDRVRREIDICRLKLNMAPLPDRPRQSGGSGSYHPPEAQAYLHVAANLIGGEATDEASVRVDGIIRGSTPLTIPITAGKHRVHLERPGFEPADAQVDVQPGQRAEVELTMNKLPESAKPIVGGPEEEKPDDRPRGSYRKYAWSLLGVAGALGLMGAGFGIAESALYRDSLNLDKMVSTREEADRYLNDGSNFAISAYVGLSLGGGALIASVVLFIVDPSRRITSDGSGYKPLSRVPRVGAGATATVHF